VSQEDDTIKQELCLANQQACSVAIELPAACVCLQMLLNSSKHTHLRCQANSGQHPHRRTLQQRTAAVQIWCAVGHGSGKSTSSSSSSSSTEAATVQQLARQVANRAAAFTAAAVFAAAAILSPAAVLPAAAHGGMEHNMLAPGTPGTMAGRCERRARRRRPPHPTHFVHLCCFTARCCTTIHMRVSQSMGTQSAQSHKVCHRTHFNS
jgi:hypothetical protein